MHNVKYEKLVDEHHFVQDGHWLPKPPSGWYYIFLCKNKEKIATGLSEREAKVLTTALNALSLSDASKLVWAMKIAQDTKVIHGCDDYARPMSLSRRKEGEQHA